MIGPYVWVEEKVCKAKKIKHWIYAMGLFQGKAWLSNGLKTSFFTTLVIYFIKNDGLKPVIFTKNVDY